MTEVRVLPKQRQFLQTKAKYPGFIGGIGSGKTYAGCLKGLLKCAPGQDGLILAPTYAMMRDVTQRTFFEIADRFNLRYDFAKTDEKVAIAGCSVLFRSADTPERLRGLNLNWAYLDEAAQMVQKMWHIVIGRLRVGAPSAWITTTPAGYNWVYRQWVESNDPAYEMIHAPTGDNTFLMPEYLADLRSAYVGEFARQEIEGDFVAFEGLVYPNFRRDLHCKDLEIKAGWTWARSIDYGYTNPFVCLWGAIDEDKRLYIVDEHYRSKMLIREHAMAIRHRIGNYAFTVADHDAQDNAEMAACNVMTRPAQKDILVGIQKVMARFEPAGDGRPRLFISPRCGNLLRELGMYRWTQTKEGRNDKEEPVKENDHAMDALRYMVMEFDNERIISGVREHLYRTGQMPSPVRGPVDERFHIVMPTRRA